MQRQGGGFWRRGSRRAGQEIIVPFGQKQPFLRRRRQRRVFAAHGLESAARKNPPFPCRHQKNLIFPQFLRHQPPPRKLGGPRWLRATAGGAALHSKGAPERMQRRGCNGRAAGSGVEAAAGRDRGLSYRLDKNSLFCADGVNGGFLLLTDLSPLRAKIRRFLVGIKKILFSPNSYDTSPRLASSAVQGGFAQQLGARRFIAKARQRGCNGEDAAARAALQDKVARPVRPPQDLPSSDPLSLWQCLLPSRPPKPQEGRFCLRACCV